MDLLRKFNLLQENKPEEKSVLEFGCSEGMVLYELKKLGYRVMGEDVSEIAEDSKRALGIDISSLSIEEFCKLDDKFDLIVSFHVVEHLVDPVKVFKLLGKMLNPGGKMLMHVPVNDAEYGNMDHFHFFSDESCRRLMGMITTDIKSDFDSYNLSEKEKATVGTYVGVKK